MAKYPVNKGIGRSPEFKGLKSQYLFIFAGGLLALFVVFVHVHGRHRPVGLHRFRGHLRIGAGLGDLQHEHEIRRMGAYETPCAAQPSPLHHQPEKVPPVVFFNY